MAVLSPASRALLFGLLGLAAMAASGASSASEGKEQSATQPVLASELELELGRRAEPYLVINLTKRRISIRLKGRSVEEIDLESVTVLRSAAWTDTAEPLEVPVVLQVARRPRSGRQIHLPGPLRSPLDPDTPDPASEEASVAPAPTGEIPTPPDAYLVETRDGWSLELGRPAKAPGRFARWWQAARSAWNGTADDPRGRDDRLCLGMSPEAAARLHHLFRPGIPILLVSPAEPAEAVQ